MNKYIFLNKSMDIKCVFVLKMSTTSHKCKGHRCKYLVSWPSSKIDPFTTLIVPHFIQSNGTACSNSMNLIIPQLGITFKFQIAFCAVYARKAAN